ncbi:peptidoglycan-binding domain-containing protein [Streptomyces globosus]
MTLPHPGDPAARAQHPPHPAQPPVHGVMAAPGRPHTPPPGTGPEASTPAYGIPVWPDTPPQAYWPAETAPLPPVPPAQVQDLGLLAQPHTHRETGGGGGGGPRGKRTGGGSRRRRFPTVLAGTGTVVAVGTVALAMGMMSRSVESDTVLLDAKPSAPAASVLPTSPAESASPSAAPTRSASRSASPKASKSASPSPTASAPSTAAAPAAPPTTPSPGRSATGSASPSKAPVLRQGDSGPEVERMQRLLAADGVYGGRINGRFDSRTKEAVAEFQWRNDIWDDGYGVYGPATRKALERTA